MLAEWLWWCNFGTVCSRYLFISTVKRLYTKCPCKLHTKPLSKRHSDINQVHNYQCPTGGPRVSTGTPSVSNETLRLSRFPRWTSIIARSGSGMRSKTRRNQNALRMLPVLSVMKPTTMNCENKSISEPGGRYTCNGRSKYR